MKIGVCGMQPQFAGAKRAGLDYMELALSKLRKLDAQEQAALREELKELALDVECFNQFFPADLALYGDEETAVSYAKENLRLASQLGGKVAVVGSGKARAVPEGMDKAQAEEQFLHLMDRVGKLAAEYEIQIAIEPLRYRETNLINTVSDCMAFCRRLGNSNVGCLVDFFHFYQNGETLDELDALEAGELFHAHLARPNDDRGAPTDEDAPTLALWAAKLKEVGYDARISLECGWYQQFDEKIASAAAQMQPFRR